MKKQQGLKNEKVSDEGLIAELFEKLNAKPERMTPEVRKDYQANTAAMQRKEALQRKARGLPTIAPDFSKA